MARYSGTPAPAASRYARGTVVRAPGAGAVARPVRDEQMPDLPPRRPRSARLRRAVVSTFALAAAAGIALVMVSGPTGGATASPYYREPVLATSTDDVQRFAIDGGYALVDVERDKVKIVKPAPKPAAVTAPGGSGDAADSGGGASYTTPVGDAQAYAASVVAERGWGPGEFTCLVNLWNKESGWNTHAANPSSGAYGIPQALPGNKMASAGADWRNDHKVQINWGLGYITGRYGSPCGAWASSQSRGWY